MNRQISRLQKLRAEFKPHLPKVLENLSHVQFQKGERTGSSGNEKEVEEYFPHTFGKPIFKGSAVKDGLRSGKPLRVGVVLSGGQAAGGHNVITGLFDALKGMHQKSQLFGFLGGPIGVIENRSKELLQDELFFYRNQGGFDLVGSGRTKIETEEQLSASLNTVQELKLDGLVVIGGDDSNTNAAVLAEYFIEKGCNTAVIGVPKTIDGDLQNPYIDISFGFDTAARIYSEMIGNIARDALSAKKYTHFIKLMGRSASHITLECALSTHPNMALIGEEIAEKKMTLSQVACEVADLVEKRAFEGKNYGVVLVPEGLVEFIFEMQQLIGELSTLAASHPTLEVDAVRVTLSEEGLHCFDSLPREIQGQLLLDRDPHGNVQVSMIETEKLLINLTKKELDRRGFKGKFATQSHFFGYEGRAGFPSNFDTHYCYALGHVAALLIDERLTGYMASVGNLKHPIDRWSIGGVPITLLMNMEVRKGLAKPVIQKALVDLTGRPFKFFAEQRGSWALNDHYRYPGPIQFFGEASLIDAIPLSLQI